MQDHCNIWTLPQPWNSQKALWCLLEMNISWGNVSWGRLRVLFQNKEKLSHALNKSFTGMRFYFRLKNAFMRNFKGSTSAFATWMNSGESFANIYQIIFNACLQNFLALPATLSPHFPPAQGFFFFYFFLIYFFFYFLCCWCKLQEFIMFQASAADRCQHK